MMKPRNNGVPKTIPSGHVLVHNNVYPDGENAFGCGANGSRAWLEDDPAEIKRMEICPCNFAGLKHYRYKIEGR